MQHVRRLAFINATRVYLCRESNWLSPRNDLVDTCFSNKKLLAKGWNSLQIRYSCFFFHTFARVSIGDGIGYFHGTIRDLYTIGLSIVRENLLYSSLAIVLRRISI